MVAVKDKDISRAMTLDLQDKMQEVINANKDKKHYYILVAISRIECEIVTKILLLSPIHGMMVRAKPLKATMLFEVDNKRGSAEWVYCLPQDMPGQGEYHGGNERVHESSRYVPIRNR
jgi:hypothetical protein